MTTQDAAGSEGTVRKRSTARSRYRRPGLARRGAGTGMLLSLPTAIVVIVLFIFPLVLAVWMSLNHWPLLGAHYFNAPANFTGLASDTQLVHSVVFTAIYTVATTAIYLLFGLGLALLVQTSRPGVGIYRTVFLLPAAVGLSSTALLFYALYNKDFGPLNSLLNHLGLVHGDAEFLGTENKAFFSTLVMVTWRFAGFNMIIMLTGLQAIPVDIYEAAKMDGASWARTFWHITLPLLRPTILLVLTISITGGLLAFEPFYVMTQGGPDSSTLTIVMVMLRNAFTRFDLGSAAAIAMVLLVALILINLLMQRLLREKAER